MSDPQGMADGAADLLVLLRADPDGEVATMALSIFEDGFLRIGGALLCAVSMLQLVCRPDFRAIEVKDGVELDAVLEVMLEGMRDGLTAAEAYRRWRPSS